MKSKKGFTLIELIAMLGIISLIIVMTTPLITVQLKRIRENNYKTFLNNLFLATETYVNTNGDQFSDLKDKGDSTFVYVYELVEGGYIKSSLVNPNTKNKVVLETCIKVTISDDGTYSYQYITDTTTLEYTVNNDDWAQSKEVKINYGSDPSYVKLFKVTGEVTANVDVTTCSSVDKSSYTCNGSIVLAGTKLTENKWYLTTSNLPNLTYTSNGTLLKHTIKGFNFISGTLLNVSKVDSSNVSNVTISASNVENKRVTLTASAVAGDSGILNYKFYINDTLVSTVETSNINVTYTTDTTFGSTEAYVVVTNNALNTTKSNVITFNDYDISNLNELKIFRNNVNSGNTYSGKTIVQLNNIDLTGSSTNLWTPIANYSEGSSIFAGTYDGGNHYIDNLYINKLSSYQGFFGFNTGTIKNLGIKSGVISAAAITGGIAGQNTGTVTNCYNKINIGITLITNYDLDPSNVKFGFLGGIVGYNTGDISNSYNDGLLSVNLGTNTSDNAYLGGITGYNSGTISSCYNNGTIQGKSTRGTISGGITGANYSSGIVKNSYNKGSVSATALSTINVWSGGIVGINRSSIQNNYNIGTVTGSSTSGTVSIGGAIGLNDTAGTLTNSYYLNTCGATGTGTSKTSTELKGLTSTLGSYFKNDSGTINSGYPILTWQ